MEKELKRGPWHPSTAKPVHDGWYETKYVGLNLYSSPFPMAYWDGNAWRWFPDSRGACVFQNRSWRGLAEKPE